MADVNEFIRRTTEGVARTGKGVCHTVSISPLSSPTAGLLTIYDGTTEAGTAIYSEWVFATTPGHTILLDCIVRNGIFVGFDDTLAKIAVTVTHS
jgi:2-hydroxy-3-keto-5-methylthiopentenyl-1-phosphate phosphatase